MNELAAEIIGALTLVPFASGAAVLGGAHVGQLGIARAGGQALVQLWLFIAAPAAGAVIGALLFRRDVLKVCGAE
ncbi:MAG: hypothetical protein JNL25_07520 [Rhodospirillaceae bacterium]|nr:hypothetical protein [Rhodospirillaceae bacterium]